MLDNITITIKRGEDEEMALSFMEDISGAKLVDYFELIMRWLTFPQVVVEQSFAEYLEEKGWSVTKSEEDEND